MDVTFFDYISISYPPLSSLSFFLIIPFFPPTVLALFSCYTHVFLYVILCICVKWTENVTFTFLSLAYFM